MEASIPTWVQGIAIIAVGSLSVLVALYKYIKTEASKSTGKVVEAQIPSQVVAASFVDSKLLRELIDALRESQEESARVALRLTRSQNELRESIIESTEALKIQTDATLNMLRFITRQSNKGSHE